MFYYEKSKLISADAESIFKIIDDHYRFSSHMNKSSWMMGGGSMLTTMDEGQGQRVGSHILLDGKAFGITIHLDEVVTFRNPPYLKEWKTVGNPKLLIIGHYILRVEIKPQSNQSLLTVSIDYDLPDEHIILGKMFSGMYAKWCVQQMIVGVLKNLI